MKVRGVNIHHQLSALCVAVVLALAGGSARASDTDLTREQQLRKLRLDERLMQLDLSKSRLQTQQHELETIRELYKQGFVALQTYDQAENSYQDAVLQFESAEINLEQTKLELLTNATNIAVVEARKYKADDGRSMVEIILENASETRDALLVDTSLSEQEVQSLLTVENIYVSLRNGPIVAEPYEQHIPSLKVGERRTLTFRLLRDEDIVVVDMSYLDIKSDRRSVILQKGSGQDLPDINSAQFSQVGELEAEVRFDLVLERLSEEERSFALAVVGLPRRIDYSFVSGGAKVSQVKFDESKSVDKTSLRLRIPENLDPRFIDRTRTFFAMVSEPAEYGPINALRAKYVDEEVPEAEVKTLEVAYVKLELIPKGLAELEVVVSNRYQEIKIGDAMEIQVQFLNRGTAPVQNIKAILDLPYEWKSSAEPALIRILEPDDRVAVDIRATPPGDIAVGNYEVGIEAEGQMGNVNIESPQKNITVRVGASSRLAGNTILIGVLVVLVVGIGLASVRISRR